jgi:hypothetical protein
MLLDRPLKNPANLIVVLGWTYLWSVEVVGAFR